MNEKQKEFLEVIKLLSDNDCLEHIILIGSWAEYLYMKTGLLPGYETNIRTLDVDFLVKNLRKPSKPINISALARTEGFYVEENVLTGVTKIINSKGLDIEFLISKIGQGSEPSLKTNLGITAQALRHLDILKKNSINVTYMNMVVEVPRPEAFVLHKMIINEERKDKAAKDQRVINRMYFYLDESTFKELRLSLSKKEDKKVEEYLNNYIKPKIEQAIKVEEAKKLIYNVPK